MVLPKALCQLDPKRFPSSSQARKAVNHRTILVARASAKNHKKGSDTAENHMVGETSTVLQELDVISVRRRLDSPSCYPQSATKYCDPPSEVISRSLSPIEILYEDDFVAVVNKPESLDTIGEKRKDLQSMLPFILRPPATTSVGGTSRDTTVTPLALPRPTHRLDRATSGCVLVAKTKESMSRCSKMFASRDGILKSYIAIVSGVLALVDESASHSDEIVHIQGKEFSTVHFPIEGKDAITLWRTVATYLSDQWGTISLVHLIPKTGRNHQIRRHLRYCLGSAILGDAKYGDWIHSKGRKMEVKDMGMFLCSNGLSFELDSCRVNSTDDLGEEQRIRVELPLPAKFYELIDSCTEDGHV